LNKLVPLVILSVLATGCSSSSDELNKKFANVQSKVASLESKIGDYESQLASRDVEIANLKYDLENLSYSSDTVLNENQEEKTIQMFMAKLQELENAVQKNQESLGNANYHLYNFMFGNPRYSEIKGYLNQDPNVVVMDNEFNSSVFAFWLTEGDNNGEVYLWKEDDEKPVYLEMDGLGVSAFWSPSGNHLVMGSGPDIYRSGSIVSIEEGKVIETIGYLQEVVWLDKSMKIAYINKNPEITPLLESQGGRSDGLYIFDLKTNKEIMLDSGGPDYYCSIDQVKNDIEILYKRHYNDGRITNHGARVIN